MRYRVKTRPRRTRGQGRPRSEVRPRVPLTPSGFPSTQVREEVSTRESPRRPTSYIEGGRAQERYLREEGELGPQPLVSRLQEEGGPQEHQLQETWTQWKPRPKGPSGQRGGGLSTGLPCPLLKGLVWQQGTGLFARWRERFLVLTKV